MLLYLIRTNKDGVADCITKCVCCQQIHLKCTGVRTWCTGPVALHTHAARSEAPFNGSAQTDFPLKSLVYVRLTRSLVMRALQGLRSAHPRRTLPGPLKRLRCQRRRRRPQIRNRRRRQRRTAPRVQARSVVARGHATASAAATATAARDQAAAHGGAEGDGAGGHCAAGEQLAGADGGGWWWGEGQERGSSDGCKEQR